MDPIAPAEHVQSIALLTGPQALLLVALVVALPLLILRALRPATHAELRLARQHGHVQGRLQGQRDDAAQWLKGRYRLTEEQAQFLATQVLPNGSRRQQAALRRKLLSDLRAVPAHQMQNRPYDHTVDGM